MSEQPFYVVETSGYPFDPNTGMGMKRAGGYSRREYEVRVAGPFGSCVFAETVRENWRTGHLDALERVRARAASLAAILNAES